MISDTPASKDGRARRIGGVAVADLPSPRKPAAAVEPRVGVAPGGEIEQNAAQVAGLAEAAAAQLRRTGAVVTLEELAEELGVGCGELEPALALGVEQHKVMEAGDGCWAAFEAGAMVGWSRR
jgi:hypothetical protein